MPGVPPDPEHVVRAWELHAVERRSLRAIQEMLVRELGEGVAPRSPETIRSWIAQGKVAAAWLDEDAKSDHYTGPEYMRARLTTFMDELIAMGWDEIVKSGQPYKDIAPIMLRAAIEQARALGGYAPARVQLQAGDGSAPELDPTTAAVVQAMRQREDALLTGDEDS